MSVYHAGGSWSLAGTNTYSTTTTIAGGTLGIKGTDAIVDDTTENLVHFLESSAPKLFVKKIRYTRVK